MCKFIVSFLLILSFSSYAQITRKELSASRITQNPSIDGTLDESFWKSAQIANEFYQHEPNSGEKSNYNTEVKVVYSNYALYIGAKLLNEHPDSIMSQLGKRDQIGQTDFFGISIDPFNDGLNGYTFIVTSANVQFDARQSSDEDSSWDAVWVSAVGSLKDGWSVEMEIPYSALRFPKTAAQTWGVNFVRNVQQTREKSFWNNVDPKISGYLKQSGVLQGIKDIEPPLRLSFTPYVSGYVNKNSENSGYDYSLKGGMDLKYGINESYTLDMMVIPDFGQVESDDEVLNITPYETYYEERRPFFTEGTELFSKGDIFYSRRIGSTPDNSSDVDTVGGVKVDKNPGEAQLINVTKISGKGKNGLGIGVLNGMSKNTYAVLIDSVTNKEYHLRTQPFTNYNVLVFDQSLKNNSYISLTNTNYFTPASNYVANVTASEFRFETPAGTHAFSGILGSSCIDDVNGKDSTGYKYEIEFEKIKGNFTYQIQQSLANKKFNPNDMGYLSKTDELQTELELNYNIYKPVGILLNWYNQLQFTQNTYFSKGKNISNSIYYRSYSRFKNYLSFNFWVDANLGNINDYYEARTPGRVYKAPGSTTIGLFLSPDYRKRFLIDVSGGFSKSYQKGQYGYWLGINPIVRANDHFNFNISSNFDNIHNDYGYAGEENDSIFFGKRKIKTLVNALNANYVFNSKSALSLKVRHYWSTINFNQFYYLQNNGSLLENTSFSSTNENANYFNIDMVYTWRFAPGSELSLVWKQSIFNEGEQVVRNYFDNVNNLFGFEQNNSISFRLVYYVDYLQLLNKSKF